MIVNNLSGKRYVGKSINVLVRWASHRKDSQRKAPKSYLGRALRKYGLEHFTFSVLEWCSTEEAAFQREVFWVALMGSNQKGVGYNLESGGQGGKAPSLWTRQKQSASRKGIPRPPSATRGMHTPEARVKAAESRRGRSHSPGTREKMSAAAKGRPKSKEAIEKSAEKHRGRPLTEEHRVKLSRAKKGKPHSEEHRANLAAANRRRAEESRKAANSGK